MKANIAVTMGDPAGVGPEIVAKALALPELHDRARFKVIGSLPVLAHAATSLAIPSTFVAHSGDGPLDSHPDHIPVVQVGDLTPDDFEVGTVAANTGADSVRYVETGSNMARAGVIDAIVTAPINKEAMRAAGVADAGHTEILGRLNGVVVQTMFVVDRMRIFFLTRHLSLKDAIAAMSSDLLLALLDHAYEELIAMGIPKPKIAVAGLNPHAGDGGLFGDEEEVHLKPAIATARQRGLDVVGPIGADSIFHQALQGRYDAVVSLYHDQGHIAAKTYDFHRTVSVTTGLPFIRTSVDHGTAFDIAYQGIADPTNIIEAIRVAIELSLLRKR